MSLKVRERLNALIKTLVLAMAFMPVIGYFLFSVYLPIVIWPFTGTPSILAIVLICVLMGVCAGILQDSMESVVYSTFVIILFGEFTAILMSFSPLMNPQIESLMMEEVAADVFRVSFPAALTMLLMVMISGMMGQYARERWFEEEDSPA